MVSFAHHGEQFEECNCMHCRALRAKVYLAEKGRDRAQSEQHKANTQVHKLRAELDEADAQIRGLRALNGKEASA